MKILYVGMKYSYYGSSTSRVGLSFEHYNFYDSLMKMNRGEHRVIYFPYDEVMREIGKEAMNQRLLDVVAKEKPDLCFFILYTEEFYPETIQKITEKSGTITFNWFADDHWRFDGYSRYWAPLFRWVGTTDSLAVEKYHKIGFKNVIKTQWACNHFLYKSQTNQRLDSDSPKKYNYDVSFIGQPHGDRKQIVQRVREAGIDIQCFGSGWPNGRINQEKMIKIFSVSKINLNLTKSSSAWTLYGIGHLFLKRVGTIPLINFPMVLPQKPKDVLSNIKIFLISQREQIKGRNFEIPGCGGFLLTGDADNLRDYYQDGKEIVIFTDTDDLINKIKYYFTHNKEREKIAQAGYQRTLRDHTYEKRFSEIFKVIGLKD